MSVKIPPEVTPVKFFLYKVCQPGDDPVVTYFSEQNTWQSKLETATLFDSEQQAINEAYKQKNSNPVSDEKCHYNVGKLLTTIDPLYSIKTVL